MKAYVYFKDTGIVRRGEIVGENGDRVIVSYRAKRPAQFNAGGFTPVLYHDQLVELNRSAIFTEVGNVL